MLSDEFKSAVASGNVLRTRIMLKDALIVDPTSLLFTEMYNYAKAKMKNLLVPFDGGFLEDVSSEWTIDIMDREMVELINNFSIQRIEHLKKVINKVRAAKIKEIQEGRSVPLNSIHNNTYKIHKMFSELRVRDGDGVKVWTYDEIITLEKNARALLKAIKEYKNE